MAERRMAKVMGQCDGFRQILIEAQPPSDGPADLGDFQSMRKSVAMMVVDRPSEHLRFAHQPAKRGAMHDPLAVALKHAPERVRFFRVRPATTVRGMHRVRGKPGIFKSRPVHRYWSSFVNN